MLCCAMLCVLLLRCRVDHSMTLIEKLIQQIERAVQVRKQQGWLALFASSEAGLPHELAARLACLKC